MTNLRGEVTSNGQQSQWRHVVMTWLQRYLQVMSLRCPTCEGVKGSGRKNSMSSLTLLSVWPYLISLDLCFFSDCETESLSSSVTSLFALWKRSFSNSKSSSITIIFAYDLVRIPASYLSLSRNISSSLSRPLVLDCASCFSLQNVVSASLPHRLRRSSLCSSPWPHALHLPLFPPTPIVTMFSICSL